MKTLKFSTYDFLSNKICELAYVHMYKAIAYIPISVGNNNGMGGIM